MQCNHLHPTTMNINLTNKSTNTYASYNGEINTATTYVKGIEETDQSNSMFLSETHRMNDKSLRESLKTLLKQNNNDLDVLSKSIGIPVQQINDFLEGITPPSLQLSEAIWKSALPGQGDYVHIGDRIEINNYFFGDSCSKGTEEIKKSLQQIIEDAMSRKKDS